jgi:HEAT repeat protein
MKSENVWRRLWAVVVQNPRGNFKDEEASVRAEAAGALKNLGANDPETIHKDKEPAMRMQAAEALRRLGGFG